MSKFNGSIGITEGDSISSYTHEPAVKRPNVVYIVLDDIGFAQLGCYGSNIETPNIDALAAGGLRYNNFHTTAICSATRASLLTGANHHTVGIRTVVDTLNGSYPNQTGYLDPHYATTAEVLKEYGYTNFLVGKWHLTPFNEATDAGPYHNWPLSKGFDRFYGFMEGYTDQYEPDIVIDNQRVLQPGDRGKDYHLSADLADQAIKLLNRQHTAYPDKPFFLYFAPGAGHAPHQAPKEYIDKYKGKFDAGWDEIREQWLSNQKKMGITPENTTLNPRNEYVKAWADCTDDEKKVYAKYMEVFAGFLDYTDAQIGRVLDYLRAIGEYDNTVIVLISDNGASAEGGKNGRINQEKSLSIVEDNNNVELTLPHLDELGSNRYTNPHYPVGWANAGNTPFQWYKSFVHSGGVKDPLIVSYPNGIKAKGEVRSQYLHVIDIAPTILDIIGVEKPSHIKGVPQNDYHGVSFAYTFDDASAPNRKHTQYYEQTGNRGIWHDGWKAITVHIGTKDFINEKWELYHTDEDFSESVDLADKYPEKLRELVALWYADVEQPKRNIFFLIKRALNPAHKLVVNLDFLSF
ncbi:MAG: arylsulfatase, partial [Oscillospiraceae bacterium]